MNREQWNALVVEDEIDSMELVCEVLEYHGIRSLAAYDANQALEILKDTIPTVIIIDLQLPGMDGWSLLREIQQDAHLNHVPRGMLSRGAKRFTMQLNFTALRERADAIRPDRSSVQIPSGRRCLLRRFATSATRANPINNTPPGSGTAPAT
jgi:CheY-like chemotaxis protein